jgi:hypothetical protein
MDSPNKNQGEVLKKGEALYLGSLKQKLEMDHNGDYVVIDVDSGNFIVESNKIEAIKKAQKEFGEKLFYIVQIGDLEEPTINFRERSNVAWIFS